MWTEKEAASKHRQTPSHASLVPGPCDQARPPPRLQHPQRHLPPRPAPGRRRQRHGALVRRPVPRRVPRRIPSPLQINPTHPSGYRAGQWRRPYCVRPPSPRIFFSELTPFISSLSLTSLGWNVLATDISLVITSVLNSNVRNNYHVLPPGSGHIQLAELDWLVPPHHWRWDHPDIIASTAVSPLPSLREPLLPPPYDLICTADTIYDSALLTPLLRSLHTLSSLSAAVSPTRRPPPVLLCLERRDPALVDRFIHEAATTWHFLTERIPHRKLAKAIKKHYPHWSKHDWEGVELWKLILITNPRSVDACAE